MCRTDIVGTSGYKPPIDPVKTEVALLGHGLILVEGYGIVRACFDACLTSGAHIVVHNNNAVLSLGDGSFRAGLGAGRFITVPAHVDAKDKILFVVPGSGPIFLNGN
jgi:hypothetical protein